MTMEQIKDCPKCKAKKGWFEKRTMSYEQYFDASGDPSHMADDRRTSGGKRKYCFDCRKDITDKIN